jgi:hypothetical protein
MGAIFFNGNFNCFPSKPSLVCIHIPKRTSRIPADFHNRNICKNARDYVAQPRKNIVTIVSRAPFHCCPKVLNVVQFAVKLWVKNGQVPVFCKQLLQQAALGFEVWLTCHNIACAVGLSIFARIIFLILAFKSEPGCQRPRSLKTILRPLGSPYRSGGCVGGKHIS